MKNWRKKSRFRRLERIPLDLADRSKRRALFTDLGAQAKKVLVITEGVIPYLSQEQVNSLGEDIYSQERFQYWITEYFSPEIYVYLKQRGLSEKMKNAPFRFYPQDWFGFFEKLHWKRRNVRYLAEESYKLGRSVPMPWWSRVLSLFASKKRTVYMRFTGYMVWHK